MRKINYGLSQSRLFFTPNDAANGAITKNKINSNNMNNNMEVALGNNKVLSSNNNGLNNVNAMNNNQNNKSNNQNTVSLNK